MPTVIPLVATTLGTSPELLAKVTAGLELGTYERVGGVIRRADNGQVVTWLRNVDGQKGAPGIPSDLGPLTQLTAATSLLNLSVTAVGFVIVMRRLDAIEEQLVSIGKELERVNRKLDLSFYANFRAALELARSAMEMRNANNRRASAAQAIDRFHEATQYYLALVDMEFNAGGWALPQFLNTLILAYVSAARCYLELGETATALRNLDEGCEALGPRVRFYTDSTIGVNPALFLHPQLAPTITLRRLTQLLRYQEPQLTEALVFERLRALIWETASMNPETWLRQLPPTIWNQDADGSQKVGPLKRPLGRTVMLAKLMPRMSNVFGQVEQTVEAVRRVEGFQIELQYLLSSVTDFRTWQRLPLPSTGESLVWLLPEASELITLVK